ncbi:hypothetical protein JY97_01410 [Alkalispirochaeta odontotermitis]|nr:hypothetical protein JY97_01410 [Alkalispirochaeta odontotermitis]
MLRQLVFSFFFISIVGFTAQAEAQFSIRYHNKKIYYPDELVELKLTVSNPGSSALTFYLSDDPRRSFGFDLRSLTGEPMSFASDFATAFQAGGVYRVVHLGPGQDLSINVFLNDWIAPLNPGQYRLSGFFYPQMRRTDSVVAISESTLDLTIMPETELRWENKLDLEIRMALIDKNLDPWGVVSETLSNRRELKFNWAILYLDLDSLAKISSMIENSEVLEKNLLRGSWNDIPGFEHPTIDYELKSYLVSQNEAEVIIRTLYKPYGEAFSKNLRFYLHRLEGFWQIRRVELLTDIDSDSLFYSNLDPQEVVSELLRAVQRGDWEIALRHLDISDMVMNLPEYKKRWKDMSAAEHRRALEEYRKKLIAGQLEESSSPLKDIDRWKTIHVNYTEVVGSVVIENTTTHNTSEGPMKQATLYTFHLEKTSTPDGRWQIIRYNTRIVRR